MNDSSFFHKYVADFFFQMLSCSLSLRLIAYKRDELRSHTQCTGASLCAILGSAELEPGTLGFRVVLVSFSSIVRNRRCVVNYVGRIRVVIVVDRPFVLDRL